MSEFIDTNLRETAGGHILSSQPFYGATSISYKVLKEDGKAWLMKTLRPEYLGNEDFRTAFRKEFETGVRLDCPYIVHYHDWEETENGEVHIWMDFVEGETLEERLEHDPEYFADSKNLDKFLVQMLTGLQYLHDHQVVHLDLKPSNIMLTQVNNDVRILDLGFCYTDSFPLNYGASHHFMAPELSVSGVKITAKADIYSLGQVLNTILQTLKDAGLLTKSIERDYGNCCALCLQEAAEKRPTTQALLKMKWKKNPLRPWIFGGIGVGIICLCSILLYLFYPRYDFWDNDVYYNILSEDSLLCEVTSYNGSDGGCYDGQSILIPQKVRHHGKEYRVVAIGDSAFKNSHVLAVQMFDGLRRIGNKAFYKCDSIVVFQVPESVTDLEPFCFAFCRHLNYIHLSSHITKIPFRCVCDAQITDITIPEGVTVIEQDALCGNRKLKHVNLPSTLERIDRGNFYYCESLREITIPAKVKTIGDYMFYGCKNLKVINNLNPVPQEISPIFKKDCASPILRVPEGSEQAYAAASYWKDLKIETIKAGSLK